jgi:hypothetical protein
MYDYHKVATLDDLIKNIERKIENSNYDKSYLIRLKDFLENKIKEEYGNITVVATKFIVKRYNRKENNEISEQNKEYYNNREFANFFEETSRSKTKSKIYPLISIENSDEYHKLIVGETDGSNLQGNKAKIYEVKSFNLTDYIHYKKNLKEYVLNKKILYIIKTSSSQLILYQYLLEKTQEYGLIGKKDGINLYGKIYFYSKNIKDLSWARETIEQNFNTIKKIIRKDAKTYNAYNLSLKDVESININNKDLYYFEIDFRVEYNQKIVENYLKNLNELIKIFKAGR